MRYTLVVDGDPANLELTTVLLEREGHRVCQAATIPEALVALRRKDIDLILLDEPEVLAELKTHPNAVNIPMIAVTAHAMGGDRERFIETGCANYIPKPFDVVEFKKILSHYYKK
ncbi:MAG: response regulator [Methanosarcinaceae archaeon]